MNTKHLISTLAAFVITFSTGVFADEIYKWTDEDGSVHYGDRPSGQASEERLKVSYNRTNPEGVQNEVDAVRNAEESRRDTRAEAAEEKRAAEEERVAAEEKRAECASDRAKYNEMLASARVYRKDAAGERVYLDEAERAESLSRAENFIKESCGT
jgi:hypothetical protein